MTVYILTLKIALGAQIADGQTKNGQFVELGDDGLFEGQETGQVVEFRVKSFTMTFTWIALGRIFHRRLYTTTIAPTLHQLHRVP